MLQHFTGALSLLLLAGFALSAAVTILNPDLPESVKGEILSRISNKAKMPLKAYLTPDQRALTVTPLNTQAFVGKTVTLQSETHAAPPLVRVMWFEMITSDSMWIISDNDILLAHPSASRYRIIREKPNHFYLEISNINYNDAGRYGCMDIMSPAESYRAEMELVVLGSNPTCRSSFPLNGYVQEGSSHTCSCSINYKGNFKPTMHWTGPDDYLRTDDVTDTQVSSTLSFTMSKGMNMGTFACLTNFTTPSTQSSLATNALEYGYRHQFLQMMIFWPPRSVTFLPTKSHYYSGDKLRCNADAYPYPTINWQNMENGHWIHGDVITLTDKMVGLNVTLKCQPWNEVNLKTYSINQFFHVYVTD